MADAVKIGENDEKNENTEQQETKSHENVSMNASTEKENKDEKNNKIKTEGQSTEDKQEQKHEPQGGKRDAMKTHYKTFTKTTLPHVLTEYGLEDKEHIEKKKEKVKKKKKRREQFFDDEGDARQQRKARDEKFRQNYGDIRQVDKHYQEYLEFLEKKVINQRIKLQKEREEEERRAREREEEESSGGEVKPLRPLRRNRHLQRRRSSVPLKHNDKYLQSLPKTDLFRILLTPTFRGWIIELQDKMKREGKLKTQTDVDKFWKEITQPEVFYAQFKVNRSAEPIIQPKKTDDLNQLAQKSGQSVAPLEPPRSLSHISEASRSEQPTPWAVTLQYQSTHGARSTSADKSKKATAKDAALDLERRCPKLVMPPLACFSLKLGEKPQDPEEIKRKVELKAREKNRKKFQRKLRKMHQLAMANAAAANRILSNRGDLTEILEGATLRDVLPVFEEPESAVRYPAEMTRAMEVYPEDESESSSASVSRPSSYKSSSSSHRLSPLGSEGSLRSGSEKGRRKKTLSLEMIEYPAPLPLTYSEVAGSAKVMEAKCMSTNWTNYMHAGKSVFAPT